MGSLSNTKAFLFVVFLYSLAIGSICPWSFSNVAHNLFVFATVYFALIYLAMDINMNEIVNKASRKTIEGVKDYEPQRWNRMMRRVTWIHWPLILLLVASGMWFTAILWLFIYVSAYTMISSVIKRCESEKEEKPSVSVENS